MKNIRTFKRLCINVDKKKIEESNIKLENLYFNNIDKINKFYIDNKQSIIEEFIYVSFSKQERNKLFMNIVGIVPIFNPTTEELLNIEKYVNDLDYCYLLDDSGKSNIDICKDFLNKHFKKVEYICNQENIGLTASVNNGFKLAIEKKADWILIMNPDGTFQNDAIQKYKEYILNNLTDNIAILAPVFNIDRRKKEAKKGTRTIKYPDMTGCLYNAKILQKLGFYDPNTYFYSLDIEYCIRVRKNGYKIIECSEIVLNHHPAETHEVRVFNKTIFKYGKDKPIRFYYQFRSAYYIHKKYHNLYTFAFSLYKLLKVIFIFDNKKEYLKMIYLGIIDGKKKYYGKFEERNVK